jgi:hypothetical protein
LLIAVGVALAWAILSVGPGTLAADAAEVFPTDTVTSPITYCNTGYGNVRPSENRVPEVWVLEGSKCTIYPSAKQASYGVPATSVDTVQGCGSASPFGGQVSVPEADGMCHDRSGGEIQPLMDDLVRGGKSGLLAFLVVGAALLLWPRLRAASLAPTSTIADHEASVPPTEVARPTTTAPRGAPVPTPADSGVDGVRFCLHCGTPETQGAAYCASCGHPLPQAQRDFVPSPAPAMPLRVATISNKRWLVALAIGYVAMNAALIAVILLSRGQLSTASEGAVGWVAGILVTGVIARAGTVRNWINVALLFFVTSMVLTLAIAVAGHR